MLASESSSQQAFHLANNNISKVPSDIAFLRSSKTFPATLNSRSTDAEVAGIAKICLAIKQIFGILPSNKYFGSAQEILVNALSYGEKESCGSSIMGLQDDPQGLSPRQVRGRDAKGQGSLWA